MKNTMKTMIALALVTVMLLCAFPAFAAELSLDPQHSTLNTQPASAEGFGVASPQLECFSSHRAS